MFKRIFHFLGGIYLAIMLIACAMSMVIIGTFLESYTESHLFAAQWTYGQPFFVILLSLFFINILFSALRRWPFKKKHIPFLITHLGLLMVIGGTIIKNYFGLQGNLSVWEGSGNHQVLIPHTYALYLENKEGSEESIALKNFHRQTYYSSLEPSLKCKVIGYAPHVKERLETWIKGSKAYIAGFPPFLVHEWSNLEPFPSSEISQSRLYDLPSCQILALRTADSQEALKQMYLENLTLHLKAKNPNKQTLTIPLHEAIREGFFFAEKKWSINLHLPSSPSNETAATLLKLEGKSPHCSHNEILNIPLQGQEALYVRNHSSCLLEPAFKVDLKRPQSLIGLIEEPQGDLILCAFDIHGRFHTDTFSQNQLQTLFAYDKGFKGYGVQTQIPFPSIPASREDKERADAHHLKTQLEKALNLQPTLSPPLQFFEVACRKAETSFVSAFVEFLIQWQDYSSLVFNPDHTFSPTLEKVLLALNWQEISPVEQQACLWLNRLLDQLDLPLQRGEDLVTLLKKHHWPLLEDFQEALKKSHETSPLTILAQQLFLLVGYLPIMEWPLSLSLQEQASLLSAYFRLYGIDYRSLSLINEGERESFERLENEWKAELSNQSQSFNHDLLLETPLTTHILPDHPPLKIEDHQPGILVEVQQGSAKQVIALAYDSTGKGLKWPILNGQFLLRFQPVVKDIPYHIRLRQARQIAYPHSSQIYSYESDLLITENQQEPYAQTLSMNRVHETWDGYRFYLAGVGSSADQEIKHIQVVVNHDPAKYLLTYPGALLVFMGILLLFWLRPYRHSR